MKKFLIATILLFSVWCASNSIFLYLGRNDINFLKLKVSEMNALLNLGNNSKPKEKNKEGFIKEIKLFSGKIIKIDDSSLTIDATLADFSKPKGQDKISEGSPDISIWDYETFQREIKVGINERTFFENVRQSDLLVGDKIVVKTNEPVYSSSQFSAKQVSLLVR